MGRLGNYKEEIETPISEQEKIDFVSGKFLYAITDFSLFKRGEAYWLEYIGNDSYCCRSDNHLNEKIRINPWELKRYFSEEPLHSFENILSEFAYHVRTWGLTDGESNMDFCNVEAHRWAKEIIKNGKDMTQEEKELVIKDLCARLPYGVICYYDTSDKSETMLGRLSSNTLESFISNKPLIGEENQCKIYDYSVTSIKPYLRTMSSMTNVEREEYCLMLCDELSTKPIDWLLRKHFDFMGLIEKGLAIEAPEGMYEYLIKSDFNGESHTN